MTTKSNPAVHDAVPCTVCGGGPVEVHYEWDVVVDIDIDDREHLGHFCPLITVEDVGILTREGVHWTQIGRLISISSDNLAYEEESSSGVHHPSRQASSSAAEIIGIGGPNISCTACGHGFDHSALPATNTV